MAAREARGDPETRYARSKGGSIAFQMSGTGPVDLVIVPGLLSHLELDWQNPGHRRFIQLLGRACRLIRFDKRGTGLSDPTSGPLPLAERVDDLLAVMDAAGSRRAVVLGMSEGVRTAIAFASLHRRRTVGLILYGASYRTPARSARMRALQSMLRHWGEGRVVDLFAPSIASPEVRRAAGAYERAAASPAMARALIEALGLVDVQDLMAGMAVPTLVLHRRGEVIPLRDARTVARLIPTAKLVVLAGRDHLPWVGDSAAVVSEIATFLAAVSPRRRHAIAPPPVRARAQPRGRLGWPSLTDAELAVVRWVVDGLTNREIAERLFLSRHTVETHLKHVFAKLAVRSRAQLAALAVARGAEDT